MPDDIKEVNKETEPSDDEVLSEEGLKKVAGDEEKETPTLSSEEINPAEKSEEESAKSDEEKAEEPEEKPAETEEKVEETVEEEEIGEIPPKVEVKPVEGETPREYALRLEVERVKRINRGLRTKKILGDVQPLAASQPAELSPEDKKALEAFDPEQLSNIDKILDIRIRQRGLVKKDDFTKEQYKNASQDVLDTWLESHPDYLPENDKGDILFNRLQAIISLYQPPAHPRDWTKILNRAHNEIMGITSKPKESVAQVQAKQEKIKVASHGPASVSPKKTTTHILSQSDQELKDLALRGGLKGFTQEEIDEMF